jgi:hypothetical protein
MKKHNPLQKPAQATLPGMPPAKLPDKITTTLVLGPMATRVVYEHMKALEALHPSIEFNQMHIIRYLLNLGFKAHAKTYDLTLDLNFNTLT